jgi:Flp pilus assembly protein TadG
MVQRAHGWLSGRTRAAGQATVEFALVSAALLLIVFGTFDFGRSIFLSSELHNAVRDAAREGKVAIANGSGINRASLENRVRKARNPETAAEHARPGLEGATVAVTCSGACASGDRLTVRASLPFRSVTQQFLGIRPIDLTASATVTLE